MFDPTIFDNLKVVLEGRLYDLDAEGEYQITGREDLVDLASMSRLFRMIVQRRGGRCRAGVSLHAGMADFAMERRQLRLADQQPGAELSMLLELPASYQAHSHALDAYLRRLWGEEAELEHTMSARIEPEASQLHPEFYKISIRFKQKIDESHMEELEQWLDIVVMGLAHIDNPAIFG